MSLPPNGHDPGDPIDGTGPDEVSVQVDLVRADLYRLIDELARAPLEDRENLLLEFERAWERFKDATVKVA
jgi:hypothetical protein